MENISLYYNIFFITYYLEPIVKYTPIHAVKPGITSIRTLYRPKEQPKSATSFVNYDGN